MRRKGGGREERTWRLHPRLFYESGLVLCASVRDWGPIKILVEEAKRNERKERKRREEKRRIRRKERMRTSIAHLVPTGVPFMSCPSMASLPNSADALHLSLQKST